MIPHSRAAWLAVYLGAIELILLLLKAILKLFGATSQVSSLDGWMWFLALGLALVLAFLGLRWFRAHVMWRLRNRLIVTYLFIGGVPLFLVGLLALMSAYFFAGQFATFLAVNEIRAQLHRLQTANLATLQQINLPRAGHTPFIPEQLKPQDNIFPERTVAIMPPSSSPKWLKDGFSGIVLDGGEMYLRAANTTTQTQPLTVISSVAMDKQLLAKIAENLGSITISPVDKSTTSVAATRNPNFLVKGISSQMNIAAGSLPPPKFSLDRGFESYAQMQTTDWESGKTAENLELVTAARISTLYSRLSVAVGQYADIVGVTLVAFGIMFAMIVLVALLIGLRLTRTITLSVANLYEATEHINRGDFSHRIEVKERDQLATLQVAFNSMTESVERLIVEQKEKERLQSELAIAQEVQALLFPTAMSSTATLELHGICRPARIVSGDYYDFLSYGSEQIGVALGDISGKGISAALLMATIHSAVRAYEQNQLVALEDTISVGRRRESGTLGLAVRPTPPQSPAQVLWLLNRQLYKSTPQEKYATLFLSFYDGHRREMVYSNAGHLPPLILGSDGSISRLTEGGTVVGLFDHIEYQEATANLSPGDIFIAYSDGVTEPENEFGEFGEGRLLETIETYRHLPLERISEHVIAAVQDWIGSTEQPDDITLVLARPRG
ncbi:MAG TPA: PP2C family protein-serine/threonine phosphatase [Candidatus Angelobacter sp.]|nr:PP2C family protein-serine/threonine phosphatase [Candidatus Angelobacter sp.]